VLQKSAKEENFKLWERCWIEREKEREGEREKEYECDKSMRERASRVK